MTFISKTLKTAGVLMTGKAPDHVITLRRIKCMQCPSKNDTPNVGMICGTYLHPDMTSAKPTCGCVINDKIEVAGQQCPQKKWLALGA